MNRDSRIVEIELEKIVPNRFQPRKTFDEDVTELAESIRSYGVLQPITVRPLGEKYEIIMGERRFRACEKLGLYKIPCIVVMMDDRESMEVALIENLERQDLSPIEEALSYKRILDAGHITQEELASKIGKTQSTIANKLRLLGLDKEVQSALLKGKISERHARSLLKLDDKNKQRELLKRIIEERLTVKRTDEEIKNMETEELNKSDDIEIIDFGGDPFKDPIPVVDSKPRELEKIDNKPIIPKSGIIDDFSVGNAPVIESNHSFYIENDLEEVKPDVIDFGNMEVNSESKKDIDEVKAIIERCQNDIRALGYDVSYEKFDFESVFQIIFKIRK